MTSTSEREPRQPYRACVEHARYFHGTGTSHHARLRVTNVMLRCERWTRWGTVTLFGAVASRWMLWVPRIKTRSKAGYSSCFELSRAVCLAFTFSSNTLYRRHVCPNLPLPQDRHAAQCRPPQGDAARVKLPTSAAPGHDDRIPPPVRPRGEAHWAVRQSRPQGSRGSRPVSPGQGDPGCAEGTRAHCTYPGEARCRHRCSPVLRRTPPHRRHPRRCRPRARTRRPPRR